MPAKKSKKTARKKTADAAPPPAAQASDHPPEPTTGTDLSPSLRQVLRDRAEHLASIATTEPPEPMTAAEEANRQRGIALSALLDRWPWQPWKRADLARFHHACDLLGWPRSDPLNDRSRERLNRSLQSDVNYQASARCRAGWCITDIDQEFNRPTVDRLVGIIRNHAPDFDPADPDWGLVRAVLRRICGVPDDRIGEMNLVEALREMRETLLAPMLGGRSAKAAAPEATTNAKRAGRRITTNEEGRIACELFDKGMKDAEIAVELERRGFASRTPSAIRSLIKRHRERNAQ